MTSVEYKLQLYVDQDTGLDNKKYTVVLFYHRQNSLQLYTIYPAQFENW